MLLDSKQLNDKSTIKADVCIIGGGPAGLTLAHELLATNLKVIILESGGTKTEKRSDHLSRGELSGMLDEALHQVHARQVGGTANHWILKMADKRNGFRHTPLDPIDFEQRDYIPHSGWPISRQDLDPYYQRAHKVCEIGPFDYSAEYWQNEQAREIIDPEGVITSSVFSFGPTHIFTEDWPNIFAQSDNIDTYIHATVTELLTDADGNSIQRAVVRLLGGKEIYFDANQFVIAAGGFDTPRLLLNSTRKFPAGLGNQNDVVGRYYVDHSLVLNGYFYPDDPHFLKTLAFYDMRLIEGASILGKLVLTEQTMRNEGLRNCGAMIFPKPCDRDHRAFEALQHIAYALHGGPLKESPLQILKNIYHGKYYLAHILYQRFVHHSGFMPGLAQGGWSRLSDLEKRFSRLELMSLVEQTPNSNNRVTLIKDRDRLDCQRIKVHMDWNSDDLESARRAETLMVDALQKAGFGRFEPHHPDGELSFYSRTAHHVMGTTRMGSNPKVSVVNRDCKVHGLANLYIAGSAVFTTGGHANPTLTLLALSIRLADKIKQKLQPAG